MSGPGVRCASRLRACDALRLIRFFEVMRGARTAAPSSDEPVMKIPHAAPRTDRPMARPVPTKANAYGLMSERTSLQFS